MILLMMYISTTFYLLADSFSPCWKCPAGGSHAPEIYHEEYDWTNDYISYPVSRSYLLFIQILKYWIFFVLAEWAETERKTHIARGKNMKYSC